MMNERWTKTQMKINVKSGNCFGLGILKSRKKPVKFSIITKNSVISRRINRINTYFGQPNKRTENISDVQQQQQQPKTQ